jgi:hypothetical protein
MCRLVSVVSLALLSSAGCATVALNAFPDRYEVSESAGSTDIDLYVGSVNFRALRPISQADQAHFKTIFISHIAKSHYFKSVQDRSRANPSPGSRYVVMDAEVSPREEGEFNWSVSWPAVYPMPFYWPVQSKHGTVSVSIESAFFDQNGTRILDLRGEKTNDYKITFYGFFRTKPAEDQLRQSYQDALAALIQKMTTERSVMTALNTRREPGPAAFASAAPPPMVPRVLSARLNNKRLAVLEFQSRNLNEDVLMALSDNVRGGALQGIAGSGMSIMTRENMLVLLKDMGRDACSEGDCEVETARNIGADYVVSGKVVVVEGIYVVTLKLHETKNGSLIGTEVVEGKSQVDVLHLLREHGRQLMTTSFAQ